MCPSTVLSSSCFSLPVTGRRPNDSLVSIAGVRTLQSGPRVLPSLSQENGDLEGSAASDPSTSATSEDPPVQSGVAGSAGRPDDNTTVQQGSGATNPATPARFDRDQPQPLPPSDRGGRDIPGDTSKEPLEEVSTGLVGGGDVVGAGAGSEGGYQWSGSVSWSDAAAAAAGTVSRAPDDGSGVAAAPQEEASSPDPPAVLHIRSSQASTPRPALPAAATSRATSVETPRVRVPNVPSHVSPIISDAEKFPVATSYYQNGGGVQTNLVNTGYTFPGRVYDSQTYGVPYDPYSPVYNREAVVQRALYAHSHAMAKMSGFPPPPGNDLSPVYDPFAYPGGNDLTMGDEFTPAGGAGNDHMCAWRWWR